MSVFIPIPKKGNPKECSNYRTIALISHASKVMFKVLQARLQQYVNHELPDVQAGFRKGTITCQSGWLLSKSLQAINAGEGVEKREPSYTVGGNAN